MDQQLDHDLLVELRTEMRGVRADLKEIKDNTTARLTKLETDHVSQKEFDDHETRIRRIEDRRIPSIERKMAYYAGAVTTIVLAIELYFKFIHH